MTAKRKATKKVEAEPRYEYDIGRFLQRVQDDDLTDDERAAWAEHSEVNDPYVAAIRVLTRDT